MPFCALYIFLKILVCSYNLWVDDIYFVYFETYSRFYECLPLGFLPVRGCLVRPSPGEERQDLGLWAADTDLVWCFTSVGAWLWAGDSVSQLTNGKLLCFFVHSHILICSHCAPPSTPYLGYGDQVRGRVPRERWESKKTGLEFRHVMSEQDMSTLSILGIGRETSSKENCKSSAKANLPSSGHICQPGGQRGCWRPCSRKTPSGSRGEKKLSSERCCDNLLIDCIKHPSVLIAGGLELCWGWKPRAGLTPALTPV